MTEGDLLLVVVRVGHQLAAAAWVGGALVYALVGRPAPGTGARSFSWLVGICTWVLALSGGVMTVDRLVATQEASTLYVALLVLKVVLALAMFILAGTLVPSAVARLRLGQRPSLGQRPFLVLYMGIGVYVVGALLAVTYTRALSRWQ